MGVRQFRPTRVFRAAKEELTHQLLPAYGLAEPPWYQVMKAIPPTESLVRTAAPRHRRPNPDSTKPRKVYRPQKLVYPEDTLRTGFYKDHPWELARPRVVLEVDGKDYQRCDWSRGLRQPGVPLSGECVVQRQLWLMENEGMSKRKAYDVTRKQFYRLRQEEEVEKRVAIEEAKHVGAYFGKSRADIGLALEDREFEKWKVWAAKETEAREQMANSQNPTFGLEDEADVDAASGQPRSGTGEPDLAAP